MHNLGHYLDAELVERLDRLRPASRRNVDGVAPGAHRSLIKGASLSFRQHRAYVRGDDPRRLDWRVLARTDRLFIREYDHDTNLHCVIAVDYSGSMAYGNASADTKSTYAESLATAFTYLLLRGGETIGLATLGGETETWLPPETGANQLSRVVNNLDRSSAFGPAHLTASLSRLSTRLKRRSLVLILSDFFLPPGQLVKSLAQLSKRGHQTICVQVLHPDEITFPLRTFTRLQGLEQERSRVLEPAAARAGYHRNFRQHREDLLRACTAGRSKLLTATIDQPLINVVEKLLRQRPDDHS